MPGGALLETESELAGSPTYRFVGKKLDEHRGAFLLKWDAMERVWEHTFESLHAQVEDHPALLTEVPLNPRRNRDQTAEMFFETFRSPALYFAPPSVLSLYASGRTTGVVLDVGEGSMHCVPVYEGHALQHSVTRSNIGGRDVTAQLQLLLRRSGMVFSTTAEAEMVKTMKEETGYVLTTSSNNTNTSNSSTTNKDESTAEKDSKTQYQLPDGQAVSLSTERYEAPEILFTPSLIGSEEDGAANVLVNSIMKSDLDLRSTLFSQIVLAGGSTLFYGFGDRMLQEVRSRSPAHTRIRISAPPERIYSSYVGGSILASLATFKSMWMTRAEFEEQGTAALHRHNL
eukprot:CAMPEP_0116852246 /NCGR_PEP_ID=MMETSP0418-20121206/17183_1 /TAXON_ID=1158023 /ORGANISM="Astrosyne radiata, Strain 13vi08-1A" /LENGTH=342 /DNA_ID=CAMNT_0004484381 /DNA_START=21 /DNA_END=1049 /DNA_ORIENTATION=+